MKKKLLTILTLTLLATMLYSMTASAYTIPDEFKPFQTPLDITDELESGGASSGTIIVLQILAGGLLYFAGPLAVIMVGFSGFNMIVGSGDPESIEQAKKELMWAILGTLLIVLSYSAVRIVLEIVLGSAQNTL